MGRKEVIEMSMESPLYFTMSLRMRLEFVRGCEQTYPSEGLRDSFLNWVRTGQFSRKGTVQGPRHS